jgi:phage terminase Nu1 subunit (DNA packaging protein)
MTDKKLHESVFDHKRQTLLASADSLLRERAELTHIRVMRDSMILAERREELVETELVTRQAAPIFAACRQKLLLIPHTLSHRLVGKDYREIYKDLSEEIHKVLREMADFDQKVIKPDWQPGSTDDPFRQTTRPLPKAVPRMKKCS